MITRIVAHALIHKNLIDTSSSLQFLAVRECKPTACENRKRTGVVPSPEQQAIHPPPPEPPHIGLVPQAVDHDVTFRLRRGAAAMPWRCQPVAKRTSATIGSAIIISTRCQLAHSRAPLPALWVSWRFAYPVFCRACRLSIVVSG